jgi:Ca2+-binding RTX toxin-like protein
MSQMNQINARRVLAAAIAGSALLLAALAPGAAQAASSASVSLDGQGNLVVVGGTSSERIEVADQTDPACPGGSPCYQVESPSESITASAPCVIVTAPEQFPSTSLCPSGGVTSITMLGREGSDDLIVSDFAFGLGVRATLDGGADSDMLHGSAENDTLVGGIGDDTVYGGRGNDLIAGNPGHDRLIGEKGSDRLTGGFGPDNLIGGLGNDVLFGSSGNDGLDGSGGKDLCHGGKGRDTPRNCEKQIAIP